MSKAAKVPVGSQWESVADSSRLWIVIDKKPFGQLTIQEVGRAYFCEMKQQDFLAAHLRQPNHTTPHN